MRLVALASLDTLFATSGLGQSGLCCPGLTPQTFYASGAEMNPFAAWVQNTCKNAAIAACPFRAACYK